SLTPRSAAGRARCSAPPTVTGPRGSGSTHGVRSSRSAGRTPPRARSISGSRAPGERALGRRPNGAGVSDGEAFAPPLRTLLDEMARPDWNTEQPEAHLLPHLERRCSREGSPFELGAA